MSKVGDKYYPLPKGELQGENVGELPDRGVSRGQTGKDMHLDGASIDQSATNRMGGFKGSSDDPGCDMPKKGVKGRA